MRARRERTGELRARVGAGPTRARLAILAGMPKTTTRTTASKRSSASSTTSKKSSAPLDPAKVAREVMLLLTQIEQKLDTLDLARLTTEERVTSAGKLRDGEEVALGHLLDTIDSSPATFAAIASHDHGTDDARVETEPTRQALARRLALAPLATALTQLARRVDDDALVQAERIREVTTPAYAILKANAAVDAKLRKRAARVFDYYASASRRPAKKG